MASNGLYPQPEVIVIGKNNDGREEKQIFRSLSPSQLIIHTGNIANWNSLRSRKTQLPINELYHSLKETLYNWISGNGRNQNEDLEYTFENFEGDEERSLLKITVKIMLQKNDTSCIEKALDTVLSTLKVKFIDTLILAIPPLEEDDITPFEDIIKPFWVEMERFHEKGLTKNISSCDLDQKQLEKLVNISKIKPEVNQVNLTSCCHMPEDLVAYAKAVDIVLHTHGDQPVMLPDESLKELVQSIEPDNALSWNCDWIVRYIVVVKCRGVIKSKGFISSVNSR